MKRKLVEQGTGTLMVSLPREWGKRHKLRKGEEVLVRDNGASLTIAPDMVRKKEVRYTFTKHGESQVRFAILNAYRSGADIIQLTYQTEKQFSWIQDLVLHHLIGLEIVPVSPQSCLLESVAEPSHDHFELLFQKLMQNTALFIRSTLDRVESKIEFKGYDLIMSSVHKYENFCRRILTQKTDPAINFYCEFMSCMVYCVRELYHTNRYLDKYPCTFSSKLFPYFRQLLEIIIEALAKKSITTLEIVDTIRLEWYEKIIEEYRRKSNDGMVMLHTCAAIRQLYLSTSPLIGLITTVQYRE